MEVKGAALNHLLLTFQTSSVWLEGKSAILTVLSSPPSILYALGKKTTTLDFNGKAKKKFIN